MKITSIVARATNFGEHAPQAVVEVVVHMDAKVWTKMAKKNQLDVLYGIDISNAVDTINRNIPAYLPTVNDKERAKRGIKKIFLSYYVGDLTCAEKLGLRVIRMKNGYASVDHSSVEILYRAPKFELVQS